jgi:hypothetical protein
MTQFVFRNKQEDQDVFSKEMYLLNLRSSQFENGENL